MLLLYHAYVYLEFLILACTIYILAPEYVLLEIDKVTFWGEHTTILGWYETLENIEKEIREIAGAINNGDGAYSLKYNAEIELGGFFGSSKIKK